MKKNQFSIHINATPNRVWDILWGEETYNGWTSVFSEGSHAVTDWKEGSKVLFLDGKGEGMVSRVAMSRPNELMTFEHLGVVKGGVEVKDDKQTKEWAGAKESYILAPEDGGTKLTVEMDIIEEFEAYFNETFPKALQRVREFSEKKQTA